jgi:hypothetical protein
MENIHKGTPFLIYQQMSLRSPSPTPSLTHHRTSSVDRNSPYIPMQPHSSPTLDMFRSVHRPVSPYCVTNGACTHGLRLINPCLVALQYFKLCSLLRQGMLHCKGLHVMATSTSATHRSCPSLRANSPGTLLIASVSVKELHPQICHTNPIPTQAHPPGG